MTVSGWQMAVAACAAGIAVAALFWLLARLGFAVAELLPARGPFAGEVLSEAGGRECRQYRRALRELNLLGAALLTALVAGAMGALLLPRTAMPALSSWLWALLALLCAAIAGLAGWQALRWVRRLQALRFEWAAKAAIGAVLKRLNLAGNSVFHDVATEASTIDHVVLGRKGVFAVNVVARPLPKRAEGRPAAELRNGKLWMAGQVEALPVGEAARNMTLLSAALSRVVGHRVPVRSVLVVPGWHAVPRGEGNHLVLNEGNLAMLTSWNTPDAFLMDEDCVAIHAFLHEASRAPRL